MANLTLLDLAKMKNNDPVVGLIEESVQTAPEVRVVAARTITGINFTSLIRTAVPSVGFRNVNEGVAGVKSTYAQRLSQCFLVDASAEMDKAMADAHEDGPEALIAQEAQGLVTAGMRSLGSQFYYGTATTVATSTAAAPTKGFPGLVEVVASAMVSDAAGVGASRSSVWFVKAGPQNVQWLFGRSGEIATGETSVERLTDGSSNPYDGYRKPLTFWVGLHCVNPANSVVRLKNLTAAVPLTDALMYGALQLFPAGAVPDAIFMSRRSLYQLRSGRTATTPTGQPAPLPTDFAGIPIQVTDNIVNTEAA